MAQDISWRDRAIQEGLRANHVEEAEWQKNAGGLALRIHQAAQRFGLERLHQVLREWDIAETAKREAGQKPYQLFTPTQTPLSLGQKWASLAAFHDHLSGVQKLSPFSFRYVRNDMSDIKQVNEQIKRGEILLQRCIVLDRPKVPRGSWRVACGLHEVEAMLQDVKQDLTAAQRANVGAVAQSGASSAVPKTIWPDREYLQDVAKQVAGLFPSNSARRRWLREQINAVIKQQTAHDQGVAEHDRALAKHFRELERRPRWRDEQADPPKSHPEWKWSLWLLPTEHFTARELDNADQNKALEGWGPPELPDKSGIPPQPIDPFYPFGDPNRSPEQVIPAQCFILAVVHDVARRGKGFGLLLEGIDLPSAMKVCVDYLNPDGSGMDMAGFDRESIDCALEAVAEALVHADTKEQPRTSHSADFTSVVWFGQHYQFTKTQALCVGQLWTEWEKGELSLSEKTIGQNVDSASDSFRLLHVFRRSVSSKRKKGKRKTVMHPAWGNMIVGAGRGIFRLAAPKRPGITE